MSIQAIQQSARASQQGAHGLTLFDHLTGVQPGLERMAVAAGCTGSGGPAMHAAAPLPLHFPK
ncbi:hypothetical protein [Microvirga sp. VF16]|uniref:hypothetical protein n=1 Tax=Microvirga sp. VF16 TaxID=2807101 RepID=UPI00193E5927|nr:hypothetical protein [Microvirga sp. VF16]QRM35632.1 hypothetical protein JO965_43175 [Microvirga sp. VF16]